MKSAVFERQQGNLQAALQTVDAALAKFPQFAKLHMIKGQVLTDLGDISGARAAYAVGVKACPKVPTLWILASRLEEMDNKAIKARALLEKARLINPKDDILWSEAVGVEERNTGMQQAKTVMARGERALHHAPCVRTKWARG
jgi:pre-mRNA-processing factor 6